MQAQQISSVEVLRPSRLNYAGWCMWCTERYCANLRCVELHARSVWEVCSECEGSESSDRATAERCLNCVGGLTDVTPISPSLSVVPDAPDDESGWYVVDPEARRVAEQEAATRARLHGVNTREEYEAAGLVPRVWVDEWDYAAGCPKSVSGARSYQEGPKVVDADYRPAAGMAHVRGWGL